MNITKDSHKVNNKKWSDFLDIFLDIFLITKSYKVIERNAIVLGEDDGIRKRKFAIAFLITSIYFSFTI